MNLSLGRKPELNTMTFIFMLPMPSFSLRVPSVTRHRGRQPIQRGPPHLNSDPQSIPSVGSYCTFSRFCLMIGLIAVG